MQLVGEDDKAYTMHDGNSPFRVAKAGLSDALHEKIKAMAPKMADGGQLASFTPPLVSGGTAPALQSFDATGAPPAPPPAAAPSPYPWLNDPQRMAEIEASKQAASDAFANISPTSVAASLVPGVQQAQAFDSKTQGDLEKKADERAQQEALTIKPKPEEAPAAAPAPAAEAPAPVAPPPARAGVTGGVDTSAKDRAAAYKAEQDAAVAAGAAKAEGFKQQEALLSAQVDQQKADALQDAQFQAKSRARADEAMANVQKARDDMAKVDTTVDPGRYWASQNTPQKLLGIIGLALGAVGNDNGVNRAAQMMNQAIDRDIDAQKAQHDAAMKKGQSAVSSAESMYSMAHQATQDDVAARAAAKATAFHIAELQAKKIEAGSSSAEAKAAAGQVAAQAGIAKYQADETAKNALYERNYKGALLGEERRKTDLLIASTAARTNKKAAEALDAQTDAFDVLGKSIGGLKSHVQSVGTNEVADSASRLKYDQYLDNIAEAGYRIKNPGVKRVSPAAIEEEKKLLPTRGYGQTDASFQKKLDNYASVLALHKGKITAAQGGGEPEEAAP